MYNARNIIISAKKANISALQAKFAAKQHLEVGREIANKACSGSECHLAEMGFVVHFVEVDTHKREALRQDRRHAEHLWKGLWLRQRAVVDKAILCNDRILGVEVPVGVVYGNLNNVAAAIETNLYESRLAIEREYLVIDH